MCYKGWNKERVATCNLNCIIYDETRKSCHMISHDNILCNIGWNKERVATCNPYCII